MTDHVEIRRGTYHDSVALMQVSRAVGDVDGVEVAFVAMGTELNLDLLDDNGFGAVDAGPNDLVIAIRADEDAIDRAREAVDRALSESASRHTSTEADVPAHTVRAAVRGDETLALVSTPGEHAFVEALDALRAGLHVMVFSDNVPVAQEVALKREGRERGLLVMGPDCGTAIVAGVGLGFANRVRPGPVGLVAASGTGAQHLTCLLDDAGVGTSHALGVGGRDLTADVGGLATLQALELLDRDPATELIVVLSKPPDDEVAERVRAAAEACATPVVSGFLGRGRDDMTALAATVVRELGQQPVAPRSWPVEGRGPRRGRLAGLFSGGTLAAEAMIVATGTLGAIRSNVPLQPDWTLGEGHDADGHVVIDFGEDEFTRGRPHPMIDNQLRVDRLAREAANPATAVVLLDVVLGHGAHDDPAGELGPAIADARRTAQADGRDLAVVVSLTATAADPQDRDRQATALHDAGASVHVSNAAAAREAASLIRGGVA